MSLLTYLMITNYYLDVLKGTPYTNYENYDWSTVFDCKNHDEYKE